MCTHTLTTNTPDHRPSSQHVLPPLHRHVERQQVGFHKRAGVRAQQRHKTGRLRQGVLLEKGQAEGVVVDGGGSGGSPATLVVAALLAAVLVPVVGFGRAAVGVLLGEGGLTGRLYVRERRKEGQGQQQCVCMRACVRTRTRVCVQKYFSTATHLHAQRRQR